MKTYNVNDNINFTQHGITLNGTIVKVGKKEADGSGYYLVQWGPYKSQALIATEDILEGRFSALVSFIREGVKKTVELCGFASATEYIYNVVYANGWELVSCTPGTRF